MGTFSARLFGTQFLISFGKAVLEEVVDNFIVEPLSRVESLHTAPLDGVGIMTGKNRREAA